MFRITFVNPLLVLHTLVARKGNGKPQSLSSSTYSVRRLLSDTTSTSPLQQQQQEEEEEKEEERVRNDTKSPSWHYDVNKKETWNAWYQADSISMYQNIWSYASRFPHGIGQESSLEKVSHDTTSEQSLFLSQYHNPLLLQPLPYDLALDNATRYVISLLKDLTWNIHLHSYHPSWIGTNSHDDRSILFHRTPNWPTTKSCNRWIEQLFTRATMDRRTTTTHRSSSTQQTPTKSNKDVLLVPSLGRPQRAHAILAHMIQCYDRLYPMHSQIQRMLPQELPFPDRESYVLVLKLYASTMPTRRTSRSRPSDKERKTTTSPSLPVQEDLWMPMSYFPIHAYNIVLHMQQSYVKHAQLSLKPTTMVWNQVLATWANTPCEIHCDKAYPAYQLLQAMRRYIPKNSMANIRDHELHTTPSLQVENVDLEEDKSEPHDDEYEFDQYLIKGKEKLYHSVHTSETKTNKPYDVPIKDINSPHVIVPVLPDKSSYSHVLRACALSDANSETKQFASTIAIRVLEQLEKDESFLLQQQQLKRLPQEDRRDKNNSYHHNEDEDEEQSHDIDLRIPPTAKTNHGKHVSHELVSSTPYATSQLHTFAIRALSYIPDKLRRDEYIHRQFAKCCRQGLVNSHVLHELSTLSTSSSSKLWDALQKKFNKNDSKISHSDEYSPGEISTLLRKLPHEWTRNGTATTNAWGW